MADRNEDGIDATWVDNVLHIVADGQVLQNTASKDRILELIVERYGNGDQPLNIVVLPRKDVTT